MPGIYAAKETFIKALGTGMRHGSARYRNRSCELGAPLIRLQDTLKIFMKHQVIRIHMCRLVIYQSICNEGSYI